MRACWLNPDRGIVCDRAAQFSMGSDFVTVRVLLLAASGYDVHVLVSSNLVTSPIGFFCEDFVAVGESGDSEL